VLIIINSGGSRGRGGRSPPRGSGKKIGSIISGKNHQFQVPIIGILAFVKVKRKILQRLYLKQLKRDCLLVIKIHSP